MRARLVVATAISIASSLAPAARAADSSFVLVPCDWHGVSVSPEAHGVLTGSVYANGDLGPVNLHCEFFQYRPSGRTDIGGRDSNVTATGFAAVAYEVSFLSYSTEVCSTVRTSAGTTNAGCHTVW
jgi:hypothetical protein